MKKLSVSFIFATILSCQNATDPKAAAETITEAPPVSMVANKENGITVSHNYTQTDTLRFTNDISRYVVAGLQHVMLNKDSSKQVPLDVLYYVADKQVMAITQNLLTDEGEEMYINFEGMDNHEVACEHFFTVHFGYPACGYLQQHLTFQATATSCYFVAKHNSSADGLYGGGRRFYNMCLGQSTSQITSVEESHQPIDDNEETVEVSFSDSTVYSFNGTQWNAQLVTPKGEVFRKEQEKL